jgi:hypothetical protein
MKTKEAKLGFYTPDETESTLWITNDITVESVVDATTNPVEREEEHVAVNPLAGMSED